MQGNWDYGITPKLKFGLRDYTPFEIGITGLQDPPFRALLFSATQTYRPTDIRVTISSYLCSCQTPGGALTPEKYG